MGAKTFFRKLSEHFSSRRVYLLILAVFVLALTTAIVNIFIPDLTGGFIGELIFELAIIVLPLVIYFGLTGKSTAASDIARDMHISGFSVKLIFLPVFTALLIISSGVLLGALTGGMQDLTGGYTLYGSIVANGNTSLPSMLYMIFTFALLPAVCEEMIFRRLLLSANKGLGLVPSLLISSLMYSLMGFSLRLLPAFFVSGLFYAVIYVATGSLLPAIISHFLVNLFGLFLQTNVANYYVSVKDPYLVTFLASVLFLISAIVVFKMSARIFAAYARAKKDSPSIPGKKGSLKATLKGFSTVFREPLAIASMLVFLAFIIVTSLF